MLKNSLFKFFKVDDIISNLTGYVETRMELLKLEIREDLAKGLSKIAVFVAILFVVTIFVFFISMALAYKIGESIGASGGFAVVAGLYLIVALALYLGRTRISQVVEKQVMEITRKKT